jgi:hypothetical protein
MCAAAAAAAAAPAAALLLLLLLLPAQVEVCIKRLRMDAPQLAAALNRIDTDKLKVCVHV